MARLGWSSLRPVQELAAQAILDGHNAVVLAPTAGGKTEASIFPALSELVERPTDSVGVLYVAPLRALLNNQSERLGIYTQMVGLNRCVWHGDTTQTERRKFLNEPTELLMTTPESLEVMLISQRVNIAKLFSDLRIVIIDEVHAMAGTDRGAHLMSVLERIRKHSLHDIQRIGLSATVGNPDEILSWLQGTSLRPASIIAPPKIPAKRQLQIQYQPERYQMAQAAARRAKGKKSLFFCQSRADAEAVASQMRREETTVYVHHSAVSREERQHAEEQFHKGTDACIVCTSTLELGIDVGDLDYVLQSDAPDTVSAFQQRMGRTGRREDTVANTTFYCGSTDGVVQALALIELAKSGWVESVKVNDRCWPVLIHQLLAMALAANGVTAHQAWEHLSTVPDFRGITRAEFDRLVTWLIQDESFRLASGRLVLGPKAEKQFGRHNFKELFAVFSTPQSYQVQTGDGQPIGSLNQDFVDRLVEGITCFLLGGRPWAVMQVSHEDRRILVVPAPQGKEPTWGGFVPQFLSLDVCRKMREILSSESTSSYLTPHAGEQLEERRALLRPHIGPGRSGIQTTDDEIIWWNFAGGRINSTLRYALTNQLPGVIFVPDNLMMKVRGDHLTVSQFQEAIDSLRGPAIWKDEKLWNTVHDSLPDYRLSKFQPLMPDWVEREVVGNYMLDLPAAEQWIKQNERS